ncbi:HIT-like domain-containing protein [Coprinopsis sp. MPI-PUGE-AT-0042]|nr:HIT-like domain-containing protein [Coprinopsis sp. MPI-PUGE-AT-0042]
MFSLFSSCFRSSHLSEAPTAKMLVDPEAQTPGIAQLATVTTKPGCKFCSIDERHGQFDLVYEDDLLVAFNDRKPAAKHHLLVCPKTHVESVKTLTKQDVPLLQAMRTVGSDILDGFQIPAGDRKMGFHIPPFNSVDHLHLHVQALPYRSRLRAAKYPISKPSSSATGGRCHKGFGWFAEIDQTIAILEKGGRVGVWRC